MSPDEFPLARLGLRLELAFGADPAGDPNLWTWVDVSDRLLTQTISLTRGRQNETSRTQPASASLVLDNPDGELTPDNAESAWWPNVVLGTPCRLSVALDPDTPVWEERMVGNVDSWVPSWPYGDLSGPATPGESRVDITVSGILRRLSQGQAPLFSVLHRQILSAAAAEGIVAYWPLEDGPEATFAASGFSGPPAQPRHLPSGDPGEPPLFGVTSGPPGTASAVALDWPYELLAPATATGGWWSQWWAEDDSEVGEPGVWTASWICGGGELQVDFIMVTFTGQITMSVQETIDNVSTIIGADTSVGVYDFETARALTVVVDSTSAAAWVDNELAVTATGFTRAGLDTVQSVALLGSNAASGPVRTSHLLVAAGSTWTSDPDVRAARLAAGAGLPGEAAAVRIARLCAENNVSVVIDGDPADSEPMGPQRPATLLDLLFECADTDLGILGEQRDTPGLTYLPRSARYNRTLAVTFDAAVDEITNPFRPILDDQRVRNDITVNRVEGSSARAFDQADVDRRGIYDESVSVNPVDDTVLSNMAYWHLHIGTWPGMRFPKVDSELSIAAQLIADWLLVEPGDWIRVTGLPPQHPLTDVDLVVEGTTESFSPTRWTIDVACSPAGPWQVSELADVSPADPASLPRLDSAGSELDVGIDDDDVSLSVATTSGPLWTTAGAYVPFDVLIGGERMTVTAISGGSSPQTFTVVRSVNGITKSHLAGVAVHVAIPFVLAL